MPDFVKFLAFDTSTDRMSVALTDGVCVWQHSGPGGAQASSTLIPAILALLAESGMALGSLDAIAFGRGPGSFTGLRTACAVAQGLAFGANHGAGIAVLPIDTLMALAEEARFQHAGTQAVDAGSLSITALLDARMDEIYVQSYEFDGQVCRPLDLCRLMRPENIELPAAATLLAGNVFGVYAGRLPSALGALPRVEALPTAAALLRLAPALAAAGQCVPAALALPLYVRDKVALTTEERDQLKQRAVETALAPVQPPTPPAVPAAL